jgi:LPS O-antigen subunit length determinant protein (WzzB/FepE family)
MADKAKRIFGKEFNKSLVSPRAIAAYAHIRKPDTQGQYADNKHKITLKLAKGDEAVEKFVKDLRAACEVARKAQQEAWKKKKLEAFDPVKDGDEKDDAEEKG